MKMCDLKRKVNFFEGILKSRGYFYDINQLCNFFSYSKFYSPEDIKVYWSRLMAGSRNKNSTIPPINYYINIPYCYSKCAFCMYPSWPLDNRKTLDSYVDYLIKNMNFYSPTFKGLKFRNLYVGGGTPNILNEAQQEKVFSTLFKYFSFTGNGQRTFECNPHTVRTETLHLLRRFGFNRISFGVQSLNTGVLMLNKRDYQKYGAISKTLRLAKKIGFRDINVDLMVGLAGDSLEGFTKSFCGIARLKPCNIVVYGLMPPNDEYLYKLLGLTREEYFRDYYPDLIEKVLKKIKSLSKKFGYLPEELEPSKFGWGLRHKDYLDIAADDYSGALAGCTFGVGTFSMSHIHGILDYREVSRADQFNPKQNIYEAKEYNKKEEMLRFIISRIGKESRIPKGLFLKTFGINLNEAFPYAFNALKKLRKIKFTKDCVSFNFNKPEEKYIYTLFFFMSNSGKRMNFGLG